MCGLHSPSDVRDEFICFALAFWSGNAGIWGMWVRTACVFGFKGTGETGTDCAAYGCTVLIPSVIRKYNGRDTNTHYS